MIPATTLTEKGLPLLIPATAHRADQELLSLLLDSAPTNKHLNITSNRRPVPAGIMGYVAFIVTDIINHG